MVVWNLCLVLGVVWEWVLLIVMWKWVLSGVTLVWVGVAWTTGAVQKLQIPARPNRHRLIPSHQTLRK
jgi:hypothetical protein